MQDLRKSAVGKSDYSEGQVLFAPLPGEVGAGSELSGNRGIHSISFSRGLPVQQLPITVGRPGADRNFKGAT